MKYRQDFLLQIRPEINQQVFATDNVEFGKRRIFNDILGSEDQHFTNCFSDAVVIVFLEKNV